MKYTYQHYLFADQPHRDLIMRDVFERLEAAEAEIERLKTEKNPLQRMTQAFDILAKIDKNGFIASDSS